MLGSNIAVASQGKGPVKMLRRAGVIGTRYGFGPHRMGRRLALVTEVLEDYACGATFPVTGAAANRTKEWYKSFSL